MLSRDGDIQRTDRFDRIGMVARWRPVHLGHVPVLRALCDRSAHALIGIGSANRYDQRNPFTVDETTDMIRLALRHRENYTLIPVPDLDDGPRWRRMAIDLFGPLDLFVTDNPYVRSLLGADYTVIRPVALVREDDRIPVEGRMVRAEMARGDGWRNLVTAEIAEYIVANRLDERFRREFGLQTLALEAVVDTS